MERRDLYEDDLTEERGPTPAQRDDVAHTLDLDPDILDDDQSVGRLDDVDDGDDQDPIDINDV
jgi:hypothetical protein